MKKKILIFAAALALAACTGNNQNQNAAQNTVDATSNQDEESVQVETKVEESAVTDEVADTDEDEDELAGVSDDFINFLNGLPKSPDKQVYYYLDPDHGDTEGYYIDNDYFAYPMNGGGYMAINRHIDASEGTGGFYWYGAYTFKETR